jgi:uncharacterized protein DUF2569
MTLPFWAWAAWRAYRHEPAAVAGREIDPYTDPARVRIGGWLLLLGLALTSSPVSLAYYGLPGIKTIASTSAWRALTTAGLASYRPALAGALVGEILCRLALIAYALALNVLFWKKKRRFPFHGKVYFFSLLGYLVAEAIGTRYFATSARADNSVVLVVRGLVTLLIWVPYLTRSRRVAETFVRP